MAFEFRFLSQDATVKGDMPQDGAFLIARFINQLGREIHAVPSLDELSRKLSFIGIS